MAVSKPATAAKPVNVGPSVLLSGKDQPPDRPSSEKNSSGKTLKDGVAFESQARSASLPVDQPDSDALEEEVSQVDEVLQTAVAAIAKKAKFAFVLTSKEWIKYFDR